jgi:small GTP-binding protein
MELSDTLCFIPSQNNRLALKISRGLRRMIGEPGVGLARVVVVGDSSVGKTSLLNRLIEHRFNEMELNTIGANFQIYSEVVDGAKLGLQIWDTAGQEKFRSLGPIYFRKAQGALVVFALSAHKSFEAIDNWISTFTDVAGRDAVIVLVGNKSDLIEREVSEAEAQKWAQERNIAFFETSAKTGQGVAEPFRYLARQLMARRPPPNNIELKSVQSGCPC